MAPAYRQENQIGGTERAMGSNGTPEIGKGSQGEETGLNVDAVITQSQDLAAMCRLVETIRSIRQKLTTHQGQVHFHFYLDQTKPDASWNVDDIRNRLFMQLAVDEDDALLQIRQIVEK